MPNAVWRTTVRTNMTNKPARIGALFPLGAADGRLLVGPSPGTLIEGITYSTPTSLVTRIVAPLLHPSQPHSRHPGRARVHSTGYVSAEGFDYYAVIQSGPLFAGDIPQPGPAGLPEHRAYRRRRRLNRRHGGTAQNRSRYP